MSSLFVRHSPLARVRRVYRAHRARPGGHGLTGPVLLAGAIAVVGHQVAAQSAVAATTPAIVAHVVSRLHDQAGYSVKTSLRVSTLLGEPVPDAAPRAALLSPRTPARASRSDAQRRPVRARKPVVRAARWTRPSGGPLTSPFGSRWGRLHEGLDFGAPHGSPVRAAFDGVVVFAAYDGGYGKQVRIRHAGGVVTTYSHMSKIVVTGGRVSAGDVIGRVGSTGSSTGPHLHFEVHIGGSPVNPRPYLAKRGVRV